jgi:hypothetical protein
MAHQPTEAVIAGSRGFALALLAPLTERVGTRPRVAADAAQALKLTGAAGLVVVEFQGDGSLDSIRALVDGAAGVSVVAAIPDGHTGAEETLRSLGVEPARWDGKPDAVLSAVTRRLGLPAGQPGAPARAAPPQPAPHNGSDPPAPSAVAAAPQGIDGLFDGMRLDELDREAPAPSSAAPSASAVHARATGPAPACDWPGGVPRDDAAAAALAAAMRGVFPPDGSPLTVVADVMAGMSPVERAVLHGEPQPVDPEPIRKAAIMRVRVAVALATAPQAGAAVDDGAVSSLLAEIDGLLSKVNALIAGAPIELQPSLEEIRNVLVKEAIDFSEAAHPGAPTDAPAHPAGITTAAERKVAHTRLLSVTTAAEQQVEAAVAKRQRSAWIALAAAVIAAGAFHGYDFVRRRALIAAEAAAQRATRSGAPGDARVFETVQGAPIVIQSAGGRPFTAEELRRMEEEESLRGNSVRQTGPSSVVIVPGGGPGAPPAPAPGRAP